MSTKFVMKIIFSLFMCRLRRLAENGIMDRQRKIFHTAKPKCIRNIQSSDFTVDMTAIYPALILLLFGMLLSFAVLAIEIVSFHSRYSSSDKTSLGKMTSHSSIKV